MLIEIEFLTNTWFLYDNLMNFLRKSLLSFINCNSQKLNWTFSAVCALIGASFFIFRKLREIKIRNVETNVKIIREKTHKRYYEHQLGPHNFNYHRILTQFHDACHNCSNVYISMKCVQLTSNYPELLNIALFSDGLTPFHRVCFHGNEPLIEFMLAKGANPQLRLASGENALCIILYYYLHRTKSKNYNCLDILYNYGCYLSCSDEWYKIFLNLAIRQNNSGLVKWLFTHSSIRTDVNNFVRGSSVPL